MIYPISFCIPESKIIKHIPYKTKIFGSIIPGNSNTYIFNDESLYYADYQSAVFGITRKKAGWDCMRHYEILANGCIPFFYNLEDCPAATMTHFPKRLIIEAAKLIYSIEDLNNINIQNIIKELTEYTRQHLTTKAMAEYVIKTISQSSATKILFFTHSQYPDYLRDQVLHGFKAIFKNNCHDFPKINHMYTDYTDNTLNLYGRGFSYTKILEPQDHNPQTSEDIINNIKNKFYDFIVYGVSDRGLPFWDHVNSHYPKENIIIMCGEDIHNCNAKSCSKDYNFFLRESESYLS